ncbi:MAG: UDP-N-acetylmuramate dehydrogenase [bacterium]
MMDQSLTTLETDLCKRFGPERVLNNEPLARHCNWRVGGPADLFLRVHTAGELIAAVQAAQERTVPFTLLGFGANVLVSDKGVRGLVILNRAHRIDFLADAVIETDSGTNLAVLAKEAAKNGVGGLEFLVGIPGTVGAAVAGNAGTRTEWISAIVVSALVLAKDGGTRWLSPSDLAFSYRNSVLKQSGETVVTARLKGTPDSPENIEQKMADHLQVRKHQPTGPSTGSVFANPEGDFAGRLIEACGLNGIQIGGARVSEKHANFILNVSDAKATDMKKVIDHIKVEVEKRFGVKLEEEIRYLGEW